MTFKPMLAAKTDGLNLTHPMLVSPKLDGVRALIIDGVVMSRSLKPIPNYHVQKMFGKKKYNGFDGELIVGSPTADDVYRKTSSGAMSHDGEPDVKFYVFDKFNNTGCFEDRLNSINADLGKSVFVIQHAYTIDDDSLQVYEEFCVKQGYEGVMLRDPEGPYKHGRSTAKQGWLMKLKRFSDSEAKVLAIIEAKHNTNKAEKDNLGHTKRSLKKAGMVGKGTLGALSVRDVKTKVEFEIGTGFDQATRNKLWKTPPIGKLVKYKYFASGVKDKPRFPVFLGFRDKKDL